jgi:hypothetical protein
MLVYKSTGNEEVEKHRKTRHPKGGNQRSLILGRVLAETVHLK